jgi:hypothetical protein
MTLLVERMSFAQRDRDAWEKGWRTGSPCALFAGLRPSFLTQIIAAKGNPPASLGEASVAAKA